MKKLLFLPLLVLLLWQVPSYADSTQDAEYERGSEAHQSWDFSKAFEIWKPLAESGHTEAQYWVGRMYRFGEGTIRNDKKAFKWNLKAAKQGHADAQYFLGTLYENGEGVAKDKSEAKKWYLKAAEQGHPNAQISLEHLE